MPATKERSTTEPVSANEAAAPPPRPPSVRKATRALYLVVFVSGAVLMGVEITGSRILAPSFGTSIFVWGSLIGLFLGAMALGYYVGGFLADRKPSFALLSTIVSLAGVYIFVMLPYLGPWICQGIARSVTDRAGGPLLASAVLFFVPSFLMAMVSPYAIKLQARSLSAVGGVAGRLYALSTFGSIAGTLGTTFVLIPFFKVSNTLQGLAVVLLLAGVCGLVLFKRALGGGLSKEDRHGTALLVIVALGCLEGWGLYPVQPYVAPGERLLKYEESAYHDIAVTESVLDVEGWSGEKGRILSPRLVRRWLKFNENIESGTYPYRGRYVNAVGYTDLLHLAVLWVRDPKRLLVVGGGGMVAPVQFRDDYPSLEHVDVLELDPAVKRTALKYFQVKPYDHPETWSEKITYHLGDARKNLATIQPGYDVVILDAYSSGGQIPFHLLTWEFLRAVKAKLAPGGVLVSNLISAVQNSGTGKEKTADLLHAEVKTLHASAADVFEMAHPSPEETKPLFQQVYIFPRVYRDQGSLRGYEAVMRNVIVIATNEAAKRSAEDILESAQQLTRGKNPHVKISAEEYRWHAANYYARGLSSEEFQRVPILHDDYAPVETMYRPVKKNEFIRHYWQ